MNDIKKEELKECPFCAGKLEHFFDGDYYADAQYKVKCLKCRIVFYNKSVLLEEKGMTSLINTRPNISKLEDKLFNAKRIAHNNYDECGKLLLKLDDKNIKIRELENTSCTGYDRLLAENMNFIARVKELENDKKAATILIDCLEKIKIPEKDKEIAELKHSVKFLQGIEHTWGSGEKLNELQSENESLRKDVENFKNATRTHTSEAYGMGLKEKPGLSIERVPETEITEKVIVKHGVNTIKNIMLRLWDEIPVKSEVLREGFLKYCQSRIPKNPSVRSLQRRFNEMSAAGEIKYKISHYLPGKVEKVW